MKKKRAKVLPFPKLPKEPEASTIIVQIGMDRFAIHYEIEDLPPVEPLAMPKRRRREPLAIRECKMDHDTQAAKANVAK
jgi:hypothetical protein